ncbi:MAG: hypothetical protein D6776_10160 [Planctomycetota bacterium]|nr:MAG: hypothetical protein D6776_10160 [Planctomycetota bacterium]
MSEALEQPWIGQGTCVVRGYTMGPAFVWRGWPSLRALVHERMPVIVVADYLEQHMITRLPPELVLGVVTAHGSVIDPLYEALAEGLQRPSVIGVRGVAAAARPGDLVLVDAGDGNVVLRPDPELERPFRQMKGRTPERKPAGFDEVLRRLTDPIQKAWLRFGRPLPYDLPESRTLYAIAWRLSAGGMPRPEDDAVVRRAYERAAERPDPNEGPSDDR